MPDRLKGVMKVIIKFSNNFTFTRSLHDTKQEERKNPEFRVRCPLPPSSVAFVGHTAIARAWAARNSPVPIYTPVDYGVETLEARRSVRIQNLKRKKCTYRRVEGSSLWYIPYFSAPNVTVKHEKA